jgi:superfamily II DNA or RNA helicase
MINTQTSNFEVIFNGDADFVSYVDISEIKTAIQEEFGGKDLNELLVDEIELIERKKNILKNKNIKASFEFASNELIIIQNMPRFPYPEGPREYQINAYNNWVAKNHKGIFAMATGTGKTLTSAYCLIEEYKKTNIQKNIIVVPGKELVEQWNQELKNCNFKRPIKWYSGNNRLNDDIEYIKLLMHTSFKDLNVIITYDSFKSEKFQNIFQNILKDFIIVFDETHNMGASGFMNTIKDFEFGNRIGLSATPLRLWDENNENEFIEDFF